jgi:hypothetical protein
VSKHQPVTRLIVSSDQQVALGFIQFLLDYFLHNFSNVTRYSYRSSVVKACLVVLFLDNRISFAIFK